MSWIKNLFKKQPEIKAEVILTRSDFEVNLINFSEDDYKDLIIAITTGYLVDKIAEAGNEQFGDNTFESHLNESLGQITTDSVVSSEDNSKTAIISPAMVLKNLTRGRDE